MYKEDNFYKINDFCIIEYIRALAQYIASVAMYQKLAVELGTD